MRESIYKSYFFYSFGLFGIVEIQTDDTSILINNHFANIKENVIKLVKIMIKNRKYLIFAYFLKFNNT